MASTPNPHVQVCHGKVIRVTTELRDGPVSICYAEENGGVAWFDGTLSDGFLDFHDGADPIPYESSKDEGIPGIFSPFVKLNPNAIVVHMAHYKPKPQKPEKFAILYANGNDTL